MRPEMNMKQRDGWDLKLLWNSVAWDTWAIVVAVASLLGLLESLQFHIGSVLIGTPVQLSRAVLRVLPFWLLVGFLSPPLISLARRFRPARYEFWSRVP